MKKLNESQAIVGPVRFSYLSVFRPKMNMMKNPPVPEYEATLLFPKVSNEFSGYAEKEISQVKEFFKAVAIAKWGSTPPRGLKFPIKDGDVERDNEGNPKYPGYYFMRLVAKDEFPPKLIDGNTDTVTALDGWQSGDWGYVKIGAFTFDVAGNKGVSAGIRVIQFIAKDEPFGGDGNSMDGFDSVGMKGVQQNQDSSDYDPFADM